MSDTDENGNKPKHAGLFVKGDPRIYKGGRGKNKKGLPALLRRLTNVEDEKTPGRTKLEAIGEKLVEKALKGEAWAINLVFDRMEGKALISIATANDDEELGAFNDEELSGYYANESSELGVNGNDRN